MKRGKPISEVYNAIHQEQEKASKELKYYESQKNEKIMTEKPILFGNDKGVPSIMEVERASLNKKETISDILNKGKSGMNAAVDEAITTKFLQWTGRDMDSEESHLITKNIVQIVNTDVCNMKMKFKHHASIGQAWTLTINDMNLYTERILNIIKGQSYGAFIHNNQWDLKVMDPYGPAKAMVKQEVITLNNAMRIGISCTIKDGKLIGHIFDPILWELCKYGRVDVMVPWMNVVGQLTKGTIKLDLLEKTLSSIGRILFTSGSFFTSSFKIVLNPVIGTTFSFGGHSSSLPQLSLQTIYDEKQSIITIGVWGKIIRCSVSAIWNEQVEPASLLNPGSIDKNRFGCTSTQGMEGFELDGVTVGIKQELLALFNAEIVMDKTIEHLSIYDELRKQKQRIERSPEQWGYWRKILHKRPPMGAASKLDCILYEAGINVHEQHVLDLGGAPGSWAVYLARKGANVTTISDESLISYGDIYIDGQRDNIKNYDNIEQFDVNIFDDISFSRKFDLVTCDIGKTVIDESEQERELMDEFYRATELILDNVAEGGAAVMKLYTFELDETRAILETLLEAFENVILLKPFGSTPTNSERYLICLNYGTPSHLQLTSLIFGDYKMIENQIFSMDEVFMKYDLEMSRTSEKVTDQYKLQPIEMFKIKDERIHQATMDYIRDWRYKFSKVVGPRPVKVSVTKTTNEDVFINIMPYNPDYVFHTYTKPIMLGNEVAKINTSIEWGLEDTLSYIIIKGDLVHLFNVQSNKPVFIYFDQEKIQSICPDAMKERYTMIDFWTNEVTRGMFRNVPEMDEYTQINVFYASLCTINIKKFFRGLQESRQATEIRIKNSLARLIRHRSIRPIYFRRDILFTANRCSGKRKDKSDISFNDFITTIQIKTNPSRYNTCNPYVANATESAIMGFLQTTNIILSKDFFHAQNDRHESEQYITHFSSGRKVGSKADANLLNVLERYFSKKVVDEFLSDRTSNEDGESE